MGQREEKAQSEAIKRTRVVKKKAGGREADRGTCPACLKDYDEGADIQTVGRAGVARAKLIRDTLDTADSRDRHAGRHFRGVDVTGAPGGTDGGALPAGRCSSIRR
ncbi:hypothetical protein GCM10011579_082440 [Streptomyces albiflavescens]|uniref:Uncharacterized protein n=1 Tax=Streptomyces albiflavescens TaxID=1623582 RepID=A0A917YER6_9ACTN|nr:hypothetical protein GCM10011579_082440 [Streptomyces albiflavescens]